MRKIYCKALIFLTTLAFAGASTAVVFPHAYAAESSTLTASHYREVVDTPADLPARELSSVREEAIQKNLNADATELAVELQKIVNAYHELPERLKDLPFDSPAVQEVLSERISKAPGVAFRSAGISFWDASQCAQAVATTLLRTSNPVGHIWTLINAFGGVVDFAEALTEILSNEAQEVTLDILVLAFGEELGRAVSRVIGVTAIIDNCSELTSDE